MKTYMKRFAALLGLASMGFNPFAVDDRNVSRGNSLYNEKKYDEAISRYSGARSKHPGRPEPAFNSGAAMFRKGDFASSEKEFSQAATAPGDLRSDAFYNLGNSLYRQKKFKEAAEAYISSLKLDPKNVDSKINLEMAMRMMQEQKKKEDKKENKEGEKKEDQKDKKDKKDESQSQAGKEEEKKEKQAQAGEMKEMSEEEANRILDQLKEKDLNLIWEKKLLQNSKKRTTEKDW